MLVLSRKVGQSVCIGEDIVVTVIKAKDGSLRLGIEAPRHVKVLRDDAVATEPAAEPDILLAGLSHLNLAVV